MSILGWRLAAADWVSLEPRYQISRWQSGKVKPSPSEWARAQSRLVRAIQTTPGNPVLHDYLAALYVIRGRQEWANVAQRRADFLNAKQHQEISLALRPVNGRTWASLAVSMQALGQVGPVFFDACRRAIQYAPHDSAVQGVLLSVLLAHWASAPSDLRVWARGLYSDPITRRRLGLNQMLQRNGLKESELLGE